MPTVGDLIGQTAIHHSTKKGQPKLAPSVCHFAALATTRCATAGVALHTSAITHQGIIAAFTTWIALVALHLCFGPLVHDRRGS